MIFENGILHSVLLESAPVVHGFTTRERGNLGFGKNPGDPEVIENRKKLFESLNVNQRIHVQPRQIHSDITIDATDFVPGCEADAGYSNHPQHLLSVLTADCVPILVYHPDGMVAAIHAGWRGIRAGIIPKALAMMKPGPVAVIGPAIGPCCYEVGEDLAADFEKQFGQEVLDRTKAKPHLDLVRAATLQLLSSGVSEVEASYLCTSCHRDLFYSFRRDGSSGRQMSFIGLL
jgi:purine-nucleoside/S-methyl-5'-thioadenosine phosphorylase / adenosine deaminase